ncbi:MAG: hypothetical protein LBT14_13405 [Treponema sp.]|jgi:hypothetical protein|nr:hypothetical protein [Treponema sp.]
MGLPLEQILEEVYKFIPLDLKERMATKTGALPFGPEAVKVMHELREVIGITPANSRDFKDAAKLFKLKDGTVVSRYVNPVGCEHVFLSNENDECIFGGWVGWIHNKGLRKIIENISEKYGTGLMLGAFRQP